LKKAYQDKAKRSDLRVASQLAFAFNWMIDRVLTDPLVGKDAYEQGVAFILETGHENNPDAERCFHAVREQHKLDMLRSISFVPKQSCRAIQVADLLAFYSRRNSAAMEKAGPRKRHKVEAEAVLKIIGEAVPIRPFVATGFWNRGDRLPSGEIAS